jgi:signal transduction histidine kinase
MPKIEAVDLISQVVQPVIDLFGANAATQNVRIVLEQNELKKQSHEADKTRIQQILINLMSNAIKFSKSGDKIIVGVRQTVLRVDGQNEFEISVTDEGLGLNNEDRRNLFQPHFRSSCPTNRAANSQSNGIGLSICRRIAENIGGNLSLCSDYRYGCRFILKLQLQAH